MIDDLSKFVVDFIETHKDGNKDNIIKDWNSSKVQKEFKKIVGVKSTSKKDKDPNKPNKPKRGKSSYIVFCDEYRSKIRQQYPDLPIREITSKLSSIWDDIKKNNIQEYKKFENLSLIDRNRYKSEIENYKNNLPKNDNEPEIEPPKKERKTKKGEEEPREESREESREECKEEPREERKEDVRFLNFYERKYKKLKKYDENLRDDAIMKKIAKKWNEMPEEEKDHY